MPIHNESYSLKTNNNNLITETEYTRSQHRISRSFTITYSEVKRFKPRVLYIKKDPFFLCHVKNVAFEI